MRTILSTSIAALCVIGRPSPAFGDDDGKIDKPDVQLGLDDRVSGEEPVDFSFLKTDEGQPSEAPAPGKPASDAPPAAPEPKPTAEPTKPAKEAVARPPVADPNDDLPIPPVKPQGEEEVPDPKAQADERAAAEKKAADEKAAAEKKAAEEKAAADKAADAAKPKEEVKLPTEEEVDKMQPKPGAPTHIVKSFNEIKEKVVKPALREVARLTEELAKKPAEGVIPGDVKAKLKQAEEDRAWREAFDAEHDPIVIAHLNEGVTKAEESLYNLLQKHPKLVMTDAQIKALKEQGWDNDFGQKDQGRIIEAVRKLNDPLLTRQVEDAFLARMSAVNDKATKIEALKSNQGELKRLREEHEIGERTGWATKVDSTIIEAVKDDPAFLIKTVPPDATAEQKAAIEAHNAELTGKTVPAMHEGIRAVWSRDPDKSIKYIIDAIRLPSVTAERDKLKAELAERDKRIAELEGDGKRMKRIATPSNLDGAPPAGAEPVRNNGPVEMSAEEAIDAYRVEKGLHPGNARPTGVTV